MYKKLKTKLKHFLQRIFQEIMKKILGTSDAYPIIPRWVVYPIDPGSTCLPLLIHVVRVWPLSRYTCALADRPAAWPIITIVAFILNILSQYKVLKLGCYLVVKASKRAKNWWKKPEIGLISGFLKKIWAWLIWYISTAIIWGKKCNVVIWF